jgi:hypothetical protein
MEIMPNLQPAAESEIAKVCLLPNAAKSLAECPESDTQDVLNLRFSALCGLWHSFARGRFENDQGRIPP